MSASVTLHVHSIDALLTPGVHSLLHYNYHLHTFSSRLRSNLIIMMYFQIITAFRLVYPIIFLLPQASTASHASSRIYHRRLTLFARHKLAVYMVLFPWNPFYLCRESSGLCFPAYSRSILHLSPSQKNPNARSLQLANHMSLLFTTTCNVPVVPPRLRLASVPPSNGQRGLLSCLWLSRSRHAPAPS